MTARRALTAGLALIALAAQGRRCAAGPGLLLPPPPHGESVTLVVDFVCAGAAVRDLLIRDDLFDVLGADYHTLARIEAPGFIGQFAFSPETRQTRVRLGSAGERGAGAVSFFLLGVAAGAGAPARGARARPARLQPRRGGRPGARGRPGAARAARAAPDALGVARGGGVLGGDPPRRADPVRRARRRLVSVPWRG